MVLPEYLADVARDMANKSAAIRRGFAQHRPSAGEAREHLVNRFLVDHLPKRFHVDSGFIISPGDRFSNQADLVVVDGQNNAPLYPGMNRSLWPVEAVYALIEVKTRLNPKDLKDAINKGRRYKRLPRQFLEPQKGTNLQRIKDSVFVIWGFESPTPKTLKANLTKMLSEVPVSEQPDFVVVPGCLVSQSGSYKVISELGQPNSEHRRRIESQRGQDDAGLLPEPVKVYAFGENSLMAWYVWFDSWLRHAGPRYCDPISYLPPDQTFGTRV